MQWIDTHCHLAPEQDVEKVLLEAAHARVGTLINMGIDANSWAFHRSLAEKYPACRYGIGLHPCDIPEAWPTILARMDDYFTSAHPPCAVGEIGLDFYHVSDPNEQEKQRIVFREQLAIAKKLDLPVSVHARNAIADCVNIIAQSGLPPAKVIFHCFTGTLSELQSILDLGAYVSFSGIVTYKNAESVRQALLKVPVERILIETDAPFLAPTPFRGKPNQPAYLPYIGVACAHILGLTPDVFCEQLYLTASAIFNLKHPQPSA